MDSRAALASVLCTHSVQRAARCRKRVLESECSDLCPEGGSWSSLGFFCARVLSFALREALALSEPLWAAAGSGIWHRGSLTGEPAAVTSGGREPSAAYDDK